MEATTATTPHPDRRTNTDSSDRPLLGRLLGGFARVVLILTVPAVALIENPHWHDSFARPKTIAVEVAVVAVVLISGARWIFGGAFLGLPRAAAVAAVAFAATQVIATFTGVDVVHSFWGETLQLQGLIPTLAALALLATAARHFETRRQLQLLFDGVLITGSIVSVYAIAQQYGHDPYWDVLPSGRSFSTLGQSNALGAYVLITAVIGWVQTLASSGLRRWLSLAVTAVATMAVLFSYSRGAYLGLVIIVLTTGISLRHRIRLGPTVRAHRGRSAAIALVALVALGGPALSLTSSAWDRMTTAGHASGDTSIRLHLGLWRVALSITGDHPVVGVGPDNYVLAFEDYRDRVLPADVANELAQFRPESPHNVFLAISTGSGLVGLAAYLALLGIVVWTLGRAARSRARNDPLLVMALGVLAAHMITDQFMTGEVAGTMTTWIVVGAAVGVFGCPRVDTQPVAPGDDARQSVRSTSASP